MSNQKKTIGERCNDLKEIANANARSRKKIVVDAGLLKAGKSSLFNALAGKVIFATDVVRATVENQEEELEGYILLDTPGLDARVEDTAVALEGYETADVILFVHNLQEGELSQTEVDSIKQISGIFGDDDIFFQNAILVLTHKDQVEEHYKEIYRQITEQCQQVFQNRFVQVFCVDSIGYLKGVQENKELLMQDSGILELHKAIEYYINDEYDLQRFRFEKLKKECVREIEQAIAVAQTEMPAEVPDRTDKMRQLKTEIQEIAKKNMVTVSDMNVALPSWGSRAFRYLGNYKDYKEYSSEYDAHTAGVNEIEKMINKAKRKVKEHGRSLVSDAENYIATTGKPLEIRNLFANTYERIRDLAKKQGILIKTNLDIKMNDFFTSDVSRELSYARDKAGYDPFSSANSYATRYSSNLSIDYDYKTKWVKGLFGNEKAKEVKVYKFDAEGAVDEVSSDMAEYLSEIRSDVMNAVSPAFNKVKKDLCNQFNSLTQQITKEIEVEINLEKEKQRVANDALKQAKERIVRLEKQKREIEVL